MQLSGQETDEDKMACRCGTVSLAGTHCLDNAELQLELLWHWAAVTVNRYTHLSHPGQKWPEASTYGTPCMTRSHGSSAYSNLQSVSMWYFYATFKGVLDVALHQRKKRNIDLFNKINKQKELPVWMFWATLIGQNALTLTWQRKLTLRYFIFLAIYFILRYEK